MEKGTDAAEKNTTAATQIQDCMPQVEADASPAATEDEGHTSGYAAASPEEKVAASAAAAAPACNESRCDNDTLTLTTRAAAAAPACNESSCDNHALALTTREASAAAAAACEQPLQPHFHPDGNREIRSMILAALPMPPMPILACKELPGEQSFVDSELKAISSHDLIAHLLNISCTVVSASKNQQRQQLQWKLQEDLFQQLDEWQASHDPGGKKQLLPPPEFGYALLSEFTRHYIQSYMPDPTKPQDVRFLPAADIDKGHVVWKRALEFQKAQDVLFGPCTFGNPPPPPNLGGMQYCELVQHSVRRLLADAGDKNMPIR